MRKSKRAKALDISLSVRLEVYDRSGGKCETCGKWCDDPGYSNSHYIPRSSGGLGIPKNILHQCIECHHDMDFGNREEKANVKLKAKIYLQRCYKDWNEEDLIYKKGM